MTAWLVEDDRRTPLPAGWSPLTGHRTDEGWTWRLMDRSDRFLGLLDGVESGRLDRNVNADIRGAGSLSWSGLPGEQPDWSTTRVQPVYHATLADGVLVEWPMGVYLCTSPGDEYGDGFVSTDVRLYDKTLILRKGGTTNAYGVGAGRNIVQRVRELLDRHYGGRHAIEDSVAVTRSPMTWEPGTPWLTVLNDLLDAAGYFALAADGGGVLRSGPYTRPADRGLAYDFTDGPSSVYSADFRHVRDDFDTPNRVTLTSRADGDTPALWAQRTLDQIAPGHPLSYAVLGYWVDRTEENVEASSLAVLQAQADRYIRESVARASDIELTHAPVPIDLLDRVRFHREGVLTVDAVVQTMSIDCAAGADWTTHLREVVA